MANNLILATSFGFKLNSNLKAKNCFLWLNTRFENVINDLQNRASDLYFSV